MKFDLQEEMKKAFENVEKFNKGEKFENWEDIVWTATFLHIHDFMGMAEQYGAPLDFTLETLQNVPQVLQAALQDHCKEEDVATMYTPLKAFSSYMLMFLCYHFDTEPRVTKQPNGVEEQYYGKMQEAYQYMILVASAYRVDFARDMDGEFWDTGWLSWHCLNPKKFLKGKEVDLNFYVWEQVCKEELGLDLGAHGFYSNPLSGGSPIRN